MKKFLIAIFFILAAGQGSAQISDFLRNYHFSATDYGPRSFSRHLVNDNPAVAFHNISNSADSSRATSLWLELGYILAMESAFGGLSYLASRKDKRGAWITGGFDMMMGIAGILGSQSPANSDSFAYYLLISAFFAKAIYNFTPPDSHTPRDRFWTNFIGLNILVFSGYYLDSLK